MILLAVDPGTRGCGCSLFIVPTRRLIKVAYVKNPAEKGNGPAESEVMARRIKNWTNVVLLHMFPGGSSNVTQLVLEYPRTYGGRAGKGDANDLFPLAAVDGALAAYFTSSIVTRYFPRDWKGSTEKPTNTKTPYVVEGMVRRRLDAEETKVLDAEWPGDVKHTWDVIDSVGIGLKFLSRFEKIRVLARD